MKSELAFNVPFSGFTTTDFINCFASTYMVLEALTGNDDYTCKQREGQPCNGCGACLRSTAGIQEHLFFLADGLGKADLEEKHARMQRVSDTMWHTFNSHNFAEVCRYRTYEELKNPALDDICKKIGGPCYGYTHDLAWALIGLNARADWATHYACGWGEMVELTLERIKQNDIEALAVIERALEVLT